MMTSLHSIFFMMTNQPYHIVDQSPWPILTSINVLSMTFSMIILFKTLYLHPLILSSISMILCSSQWWRDIPRESTFQGYHTNQVLKGLKTGFLLFILSEVMFFVSFFWAFLHSSLSPSIQIGSMWPPMSIITFDPSLIPLLNTTILLSSGITITWAHHASMNSNFTQTKNALLMTIIMGIYFTVLQAWEYFQAPFSMSDSIYGSTFFISTGFHGIHVIIGSTFLMITLIRLTLIQFSSYHHFGFEAAAWYWHFVDIIWLFLYSILYWWSK